MKDALTPSSTPLLASLHLLAPPPTWGFELWRLNNGCCNIQAQPWEVISANIKLLQHALKLSLLQGNLALAIHQTFQKLS